MRALSALADVKPKLLIIELWAVGDVVIGTPLLQKACEEYEVTLLAKPFASICGTGSGRR